MTATPDIDPENFVDIRNHAGYFNPVGIGRIDVVGVGATGSWLVMALAKLGLANIHVWDADVVEAKNVSNQLYGNQHVGMPKVEALKQIIKDFAGLDITTHNQFCTSKDGQSFGYALFLLVDTMSARADIWEGAMFNLSLRHIIETRLASDAGKIYTIDRRDEDAVAYWVASLAGGDNQQMLVSECGTTVNMGPTAGLLANYAAWQFVLAHLAAQSEDNSRPEWFSTFGVGPISASVYPVKLTEETLIVE